MSDSAGSENREAESNDQDVVLRAALRNFAEKADKPISTKYDEADPDGDLLITLVPSTEAFAPPLPYEGNDNNPDKRSLMANHSDSSSVESAIEDDDEDAAEELQVLKIKASSKHMCRASPRFKSMLTGPWIEATTIYDDGLRHVDMEGFDTQAFQYVIYIIHGNNRRLPHSFDLDTLGKIALVVDDLQCDEAVERHVLGWAIALHREAARQARVPLGGIWSSGC